MRVRIFKEVFVNIIKEFNEKFFMMENISNSFCIGVEEVFIIC